MSNVYSTLRTAEKLAKNENTNLYKCGVRDRISFMKDAFAVVAKAEHEGVDPDKIRDLVSFPCPACGEKFSQDDLKELMSSAAGMAAQSEARQVHGLTDTGRQDDFEDKPEPQKPDEGDEEIIKNDPYRFGYGKSMREVRK